MTYKDFPKVSMGGSDIATLTLVGIGDKNSPDCMKAQCIYFGGDGSYEAYIIDGVDEKVEIGEHYTKVAEFTTWMWVYDDESRVYKTPGYAEKINVYRAGGYGMIIEIIRGED